MLNAIVSGKAGRVVVDGVERTVSWREMFRRSEDLMTAAVFGRLRYLSTSLLTRVMGSLVTPAAAANFGDLQRVDFWPNLEGTHGRVRVQPDVLMWFKGALVMVEVKPPFGGDQSPDQWRDQIRAVAHLAQRDDEPFPNAVHFVGLGRNRNTSPLSEVNVDEFDTGGNFELFLYEREWDIVASVLRDMRDEAVAADAAVLEDLSSALQLFGMLTERYTWTSLLEWANYVSLSFAKLAELPFKTTTSVSQKSRRKSPDWLGLVDFSSLHPISLQP